jgi:hypothetical protein
VTSEDRRSTAYGVFDAIYGVCLARRQHGTPFCMTITYGVSSPSRWSTRSQRSRYFIGSAESGRAGKGAIMIRIGTDLITLIVVDVVLAFAAAWMPWFPGDLQIARAIQHFGPSG